MAYEIKISGKNDTIIVSNEQGVKIKAVWNDKTKPKDTKLLVGNTDLEKGMIRFITQVEDSSSTLKKNNQVTVDVEKEQKKIYLEWKNKTAKEKAERIELFKQCYKIINSTFPPEDVLNSLKKDLISFFEEKPKRTYADPNIYVLHFGNIPDGKNVNRFEGLLVQHSFKILEQVIALDMEQAKFL